jgi:hypothetical protein
LLTRNSALLFVRDSRSISRSVAAEGRPSPTDIRFAANWPDRYYVLVSPAEDPPPVRAFRIVDGEVAEEPLDAA